MRQRKNNPGFVLLMALAILAIAGTILAAASRRCCGRVLDASAARQGLQVAWGTLSLQATCLGAAEDILTRDSVRLDRPVVWSGRRIALGGMTFHVVVSDEQAKANVNLIAKLRGDRTVASSLSALQSGLSEALHVVPRPQEQAARPGSPGEFHVGLPMLYGSYEQLFDMVHPSQLFARDSHGNHAGHRPAAIDRFTCWGSGQVNFRRADPAVLREVLLGALDNSDVGKILAFRQKQPDGTRMELMTHLDLASDKALKASELLTDTSACHSVWIIAEGSTRKWYRLYVQQSVSPEGGSGQWVFQW
jgi:hypothetical protein